MKPSYSFYSQRNIFVSWERMKLVQNQTDVSMNLAKHVFTCANDNNSNANMVCSPLSIQIILGLIAAGAKGPTLYQLLHFLKFDSVDELNVFFSWVVNDVFADGSSMGGPRLSVANGAWIDQTLSFKHSFKEVMDNVYKAASNSVDFQNKAEEVVNEVNQWAKEKTNGLIDSILFPGSADKDTRLIFANALYFKGEWLRHFNASYTKDHEFHLLNGSTIQAPSMTRRGFSTQAAAYDGFKVLGLPYKSGDDSRSFNMYFILPDTYNGLPNLLERLSAEPGFLNRHIQQTKRLEVSKLLIPKFKIEHGFDALDVLKQLGLTLSGDFMEIADNGYPISVSKILHKAFVEVNEEGTEAAAVTVCITCFGSSPYQLMEEKIEFVADHPFLFLIKDDVTGVVLFVGTVLNPLV